MIGTSIAIIGVFLLLFAAFIVKDIVAAKRSVRKTVHFSVRESIGAYLMLLPALALICLFVLLPIVYSLGYAFTDYYLLRPNDVGFVGFENFADIIKNIGEHGTVYNAIMNTLKFVVFVVPLQIGMALGLALLVNKRARGMGVFNGDLGIIRKINPYAELVTVEYEEGRFADYTYKQTEELELAYATTIHKAQGSEYPAVIIPLLGGPRMLMTRNLLYTAVTRARKCVTLVGSDVTFQAMIENHIEENRYTTLAERIVECSR